MFLLLPAPPSLNEYYVVQKRGEFYTKVVSKKGVLYQSTIKLLKRKLNIPLFDGDLQITLDCFPYSKNTRDIDNYYKCLLDSLQFAEIITNDNNIRWELGRMQLPCPVKNWSWGNSMILLDIKQHHYQPLSLPEKIIEILENGNEIVGLQTAPQNIIKSIKSEQDKLFK